MTKPVLSIITAVLNGERVLPSLIASIRDQWDPRLEFIVVDGGSTDGTPSIINENSDLISKWISEPDSGIYNAWNKGLRMASGTWIAFIGADDIYLPGGLAAYLNAAIAAPPQTQLISSKVRFEPLYGAPRIIGAPWRWAQFQERMTIAHVGSLHRFSLFDEYGNYDESYRICGDYEMLLRPKSHLKTQFIDFLTVRMGGGGVSNNQFAKVFEEVCRAKSTTGGRNRVLSEVESRWGYLKSRVKQAMLKRHLPSLSDQQRP